MEGDFLHPFRLLLSVASLNGMSSIKQRSYGTIENLERILFKRYPEGVNFETRKSCLFGPGCWKRLGVTLALICAFLGSLKGWMVSVIAGVGPVGIFGLRSLGATAFLLPIILHSRHDLCYGWKMNFWLLLRSVVGNVAVGGYYYGLTYLPLADASLIYYSTPLYTTVLGCLFLGESCGLINFLSIGLVSLGLLLVCCPVEITSSGFFFDFSSLIGDDLAFRGAIGSFVGALAQAVAFVIVRKLTDVPVVVSSFWWAVVGVLSSGAWVSVEGVFDLWGCGLQGILVVGVALIGFLSETTMIASLYLEEAGKVSLLLTTEIIWSFVLQTFLQDQVPSGSVMLGGVTILFAVLLPKISSLASDSLKKAKNQRRFSTPQSVAVYHEF